MRLRQQLDLLEKRGAEAIAVEEADIEQQEADDAVGAETASLEGPTGDLALHLSPDTWNALSGGCDLPSDFWTLGPDETPLAEAGSSGGFG
jgi:hypothetical protein